ALTEGASAAGAGTDAAGLTEAEEAGAGSVREVGESPQDELCRLREEQAADNAELGTRRALGEEESTDALDHAEPLESEIEPDPGEPGRISELESQEPRPTGE